ncbi:Aquaporin-7 [Varanus komodoensis]|nr:Aquaporin-7 [Varanus komodoensis]
MLDRVISLVTVWDETVRQSLAEALATFLLMVRRPLPATLGSMAQVVLGKKNFGEYLSNNLGFGFGVMLLVESQVSVAPGCGWSRLGLESH